MYCVFKKNTSSTHHHQPEQEQVDESSNRAMYEEITSTTKEKFEMGENEAYGHVVISGRV